MAIIKGWVFVRNNSVGYAFREEIKKSLTIVGRLTSSFQASSPVVQLFEEHEDGFYVPRGFFNMRLRPRGVEGFFVPSSGSNALSDVEPIQLRPGQPELVAGVVNECRKNPFGGAIIYATVGGGKSAMALEISRRLGLKTLVLCPTSVLLEQWQKEIAKFFPTWSVGRLQADKIDIHNRDIVVGTIQSAALKEYEDYVYDAFGTIVADECLDGDTLIQTPKGLVRIRDVSVGDTVITPNGTATVINKKKTIKKSFRYVCDNGSYLISSAEHIVPNAFSRWKGRRIYSGRGVDYRNIPISHADHLLLVGKPLVSNERFSKENYFYEMIGWMIADGFISADKSVTRFAFTKKQKFDALKFCLNGAGVPYKESKCARGDLIIRLNSNTTRRVLSAYPEVGCGKKSGITRFPDVPSIYLKDVARGVFNGDGDVSASSASLNSCSLDLIKDMHRVLSSFGIFSWFRKVRNADGDRINALYRLTFGSSYYHFFMKSIGCSVPFKAERLLRLGGAKSNRHGALIVSVEDAGERPLYDLEIDDEDKIFIANGFKVHNCHLASAQEYSNALKKFSARYLIGATGTLKRADGLDPVFYYSSGPVVEAPKVKNLEPTIYFVDTRFAHVFRASVPLDRQVHGFLEKAIENPARNEIIIRQAEKAALAGRNILILTKRVNHARLLHSHISHRLAAHGLTCGMAIGEMKQADREKSYSANVIVATTQLIATGFNEPRLDTLIMATPIAGNTLLQAIGRIRRLHDGKRPPFVLDLVDSRYEGAVISAKSRFNVYLANEWIVNGYELFDKEYLCSPRVSAKISQMKQKRQLG